MLRKCIITLAAAASLGTVALAPGTASAAWHSWGHRDAIEDRLEHRAFFRHRIAFDRIEDRLEHRSFFRHPFRRDFAFVRAPLVADGCLRLRHVWTPWGWRWHRVWVCG